MQETVLVEMLEELKEKAHAFKLAFIDPAVQPEDLVMESMPKLLALPDCKTKEEMRRLALTTFYNVCRDMQRQAMRRQGAHFTDVPLDELQHVAGPFSLNALLLRLGVRECLETLSEQDRRLVMELMEPTAPVLELAHKRQPRGQVRVHLRDVATAHNVSVATVGRAMKRARLAMRHGQII